MPTYADFGDWVISTIAGWFVVTADSITQPLHPHLFRHQMLTYLTSKGLTSAMNLGSPLHVKESGDSIMNWVRGYSWEIIPDAGLTAGNVFTYAEAGFLVRIGRGLKADWGPR